MLPKPAPPWLVLHRQGNHCGPGNVPQCLSQATWWNRRQGDILLWSGFKGTERECYQSPCCGITWRQLTGHFALQWGCSKEGRDSPRTYGAQTWAPCTGKRGVPSAGTPGAVNPAPKTQRHQAGRRRWRWICSPTHCCCCRSGRETAAGDQP